MNMTGNSSRYVRLLIRFVIVALGLSSTFGREFFHPGVLHSQADLKRMEVAVAKGAGPIYEGFKVLRDSQYSKSDYRTRGPFPEFGRAPNIRTGEAQSDAQAAYENALMWAITGKQAHADKAIEIVNAWMGSLKKVTGIDGVLAAGLQGHKFVNAAEIDKDRCA